MMYQLTLVSPDKYQAFMFQEFGKQDSIKKELWHEFRNDREPQFKAMSVYLVPLNEIREIVSRDFPAVVPLIERPLVRMDTSDLDEDENFVYSDVETDRFVDCWRRVAKQFAS
jgi:hypothetical protein